TTLRGQEPPAADAPAAGAQNPRPPGLRGDLAPGAPGQSSSRPGAPPAGGPEEGAPAVPSDAAKAWEDLLLLQATRYLRLTPTQIEQLRPVARRAGSRLARLRDQEEPTLADLRRMALRQREALVAGRNISLQEQSEALSRRNAMRQRRAAAEAEIVREALP